jgi:DNA-binding MarR family transcriptional regulator
MVGAYKVNMVDLKSEELLRSAIELMYFAYRAFTAGPDRVLAQRGLGRVHHRILYFVGRNPELSVKSLLDRLAVTKQALHQPLQQLIEMGLITNASDEKDGRVRRLRLSTEGTRLEAKLSAVQMKQLSEAFAKSGATAARGWFSVMREVAGTPIQPASLDEKANAGKR